MNLQTIIIFILAIFMGSCNHIKTDAAGCMENADMKDRLLVFIGEKIEVKPVNDEKDIMDAKFIAKYKVLEIVCGHYTKDTISFIVYDHYGIPAFERYKNVLLYLSNYNDTFYHEKYEYNDVYKTKDGRWASPYSAFEHNLKAVSIEFESEVSFPIKDLSKKSIKYWFPNPYYKIRNDSAIALWGNYVPELFEMKKTGILNARGYFGTQDSIPEVVETQMAEITENKVIKVSNQDSIELMKTWSKLITALQAKDSTTIHEMSANKLDCKICDNPFSDYYDNTATEINDFIYDANKALAELNFTKEHKIINIFAEKERENIENQNIKKNDILYKITCQSKREHYGFGFVKKNGQFIFYGIVY